jgi:hypothetical protein
VRLLGCCELLHWRGGKGSVVIHSLSAGRQADRQTGRQGDRETAGRSPSPQSLPGARLGLDSGSGAQRQLLSNPRLALLPITYDLANGPSS